MKYAVILLMTLFDIYTLKSQNYFEQLPFPDSNLICAIACNQQGDIFASAISQHMQPNDGIYKSDDSGQTWNMILSIGQAQSQDLKIDNIGNLYALKQFDTNETLLKSSDNGQTWNSIYVPIDIYWSNSKIFIQGIDTLFISQHTGSFTRLLRSYNDGINWDTVFYRTDYGSETILDLAFGNEGEIFMAISGYFEGTGGLFKSNDYGSTWTLFGLQGNMVNNLCYDSSGDLFIASLFGPNGIGLFEVFHGANDVIHISPSLNVSSVVINSSDDIFSGNFYGGVVYHSSDGGLSYDIISSGLNIYFGIEYMYIDPNDYIFAFSCTNTLYRSVQPTITASENNKMSSINLFPNPCNEVIKGHVNMNFNKDVEFEIYDCVGNITVNGVVKITNGDFCIATSALNNGVYCLRMKLNTSSTILFIKL